MKCYYAITTIDPVILSQTVATTNNHQGLDYIPGSAILGVIAHRLYAQLGEAESWLWFHSGEVQFSYAYPVIEKQWALPVPLCWHREKGENIAQAGRLNRHIVSFSGLAKAKPQIQYQQCRHGFVTSNGRYGEVKQGVVTKTALNRQTGDAKDHSLHSYSYIDAGQTFIGWVECPTEAIKQTMACELAGEHRLGRSRGSEFGRVTVSVIDPPYDIESASSINRHKRLVLWCVSDCQCVNQQGFPTYSPNIDDIVPEGRGSLNRQQSFIRHSVVSRFNQQRAGLDSEQLLIAKGSVLVFDDVSISDEQLQKIAATGIGLNRQQGLGWVIVNPWWSQQVDLPFEALFPALAYQPASLSPQSSFPELNSGLLSWVAHQQQLRQGQDVDDKIAHQTLSYIVQAYQAARRYNHIHPTYSAGPSRSQWRRMSDALRHAHHDWWAVLFEGEHKICQPDNDTMGWGIEWDDGKQFICFADHLQGLLNDLSVTQLLRLLVLLGRYDLSLYSDLKRMCDEYDLHFVGQKVMP